MNGNRVAPATGSGELSADQLRTLQSTADELAASVRDQLSDAFAVDADVVATPGGPQGAVSVQPPDAPPVAAGIPIDEAEGLTVEHRDELVVDLVAAAVGRARSTVGDRILPAAQ